MNELVKKSQFFTFLPVRFQPRGLWLGYMANGPIKKIHIFSWFFERLKRWNIRKKCTKWNMNNYSARAYFCLPSSKQRFCYWVLSILGALLWWSVLNPFQGAFITKIVSIRLQAPAMRLYPYTWRMRLYPGCAYMRGKPVSKNDRMNQTREN